MHEKGLQKINAYGIIIWLFMYEIKIQRRFCALLERAGTPS